MALENVREFLGRLSSDPSLAERADDAYVAELLSVARDAGYDVSEGELRTALDGAHDEVSPDELDKVVGGSQFLTADVSRFNTAGIGANFETAFGGFGSFSSKGYSK